MDIGAAAIWDPASTSLVPKRPHATGCRGQRWAASGQPANWGVTASFISTQAAYKLPEPTATSRHTFRPGPAHQESSTHSICQWTGPSPALASRPALLTRGQTPHQRKPQSCNGMSPPKREARPSPGISRSLALPTSRATQALRHPRPTPNCVSNRSPVTRPRNWVSPSPASNLTTAQGSLSPVTKLQDPALPTSRPALNPAPGFSHQWAGNGPGIFWALTLPTSEPAPTQGP